jgi:chaperonin GroEL (HSP60 family)
LEAQEACKRTWETTADKKDYGIGYDILIDALSLPAKTIAENAGLDGDIVVAESKSKKLGYNALTGTYEDLVETGVIDPAKVTRCALENAASVAGLLLTTQCILCEKPQEDNNNAFQPTGSPMMM